MNTEQAWEYLQSKGVQNLDIERPGTFKLTLVELLAEFANGSYKALKQLRGTMEKSDWELSGAEEALRYSAAEPDWRKMCIVELAIENQSVRDYVEHWEGRALKAEAKVAEGHAQAPAQPLTLEVATMICLNFDIERDGEHVLLSQLIEFVNSLPAPPSAVPPATPAQQPDIDLLTCEATAWLAEHYPTFAAYVTEVVGVKHIEMARMAAEFAASRLPAPPSAGTTKENL